MIAFCCILKKPAIEFLGCCTRMLQLSTFLGDNIACCPAKVEKGQTVFFFSSFFFKNGWTYFISDSKSMWTAGGKESTQRFPDQEF